MTIKNYKTIVIPVNSTTSANTFSIPIFLPFIPSHFIIKYFCYNITSTNAPTNRIVLLKTSLLNNESILSFARVANASSTGALQLDLKHKMNPSTISGNYDFTMCNIDGDIPDGGITSIQFALTVEFVEEI
jgi:hypothetical protein